MLRVFEKKSGLSFFYYSVALVLGSVHYVWHQLYRDIRQADRGTAEYL